MKIFGSGCTLLLTTALATVFSGVASAQTTSGGGVLDDVVVTATRTTDTVNKAPLSITAVTQERMDAQGLRTVDDLTRVAPALTLRRGLDSSSTIALRGIISAAGAQTTGVYIDDTPMQKRVSIGAANGNGAPTPFLYDLERVEVLRGPQGTLYGGSSLGGTIRFITPTPSLDEASASARSEVSFTEDGDPSYEIGAAVGGPIVEGKLGYRASVYGKQAGGYIDHKNPYTGVQFSENTNDEVDQSMRVALRWAATENLTITPTLFVSYQKLGDTDFYFEDVPQYSVGPITTANTGTGFPSYTYPVHTYGPIKAGPYTSLLLGNYHRENSFALPVLNVDYDFGALQFKSITSYLRENADGRKEGGLDQTGGRLGGSGLISELPNHRQLFDYTNSRTSWTQEVRLSTAPRTTPISFVAGAYFQHAITTADYKITENLDEIARAINGADVTTIYRAPMLDGVLSGNRYQHMIEDEIAAFGEATLHINDQLSILAGARTAENEFKFDGFFIGPLVGSLVASVPAGSATVGSVKESPFTYKGGINFQATNNALFYGSVSKGYRPGGVNTTQQSVNCAAALAAYGGPPPDTYGSDTVISYEAGAKLRIADRVQLNTSIFRINWSDIQTSLTLPNCFAFVANAAEAVSQGVDVQLQAQVTEGLSVNLAVGYDKAEYSETLLGPTSATNGSRALIINKGDQLPAPPWTVALGAQYDWSVGSIPWFIRADYQFNSAYHRTFSAGTTTYNPDLFPGDDTSYLSARMGMKFANVDASFFVNNLTNSTDAIDRIGGRTGCSNVACTTASSTNNLWTRVTFRPRTFGVTLAYRH